MIKDDINLDGAWEFSHTTDVRSLKPVDQRVIQVPGPWQAQFPDLRMKSGMGLYRRSIDLPAGWRQGQIKLCFGAVFHRTRAWVNGLPVGMHDGGFLPFSFDVTAMLVDGHNDLFIQAESPTDDPNEHPESPFADIPFGKQSWYGPQSGIWQSVRLERRDPDHLCHCRIVADLKKRKIEAKIRISRPASEHLQLCVTILDPAGEEAAVHRADIDFLAEEITFTVGLENVRAWSVDTPHLYRMRAVLERNGEPIDALEENFGFRCFETKGGKFYLNGEPIYLRAALDQDYYPDTLCTTPSTAFLEDQFRKAKQLGLNCLRCHIKAPDPRYYEVADRIGLLIWSELPNGGRLNPRSRARAETTLRGIIDRDGNHPSIICWTIINENWGTDLVHNAKHRSWLKETYLWLKQYDPTRLVVDNSPLAPSMHIQTDIADFHFYAAIPDRRQQWDAFVKSLASRPDWLFSQEGDAVLSGEEPLMCSEFGNWGLPDPTDLVDAEGKEPWWFETGHDWGEGVMYAHGLEHRFADWSLDRVFGSLRGFIEAAQWQQFRALKYEIESMRIYPQLAGYVITELTDCHWESNGLLDMRRNPRVFHSVFPSINADTILIPRVDRFAYWSKERMHLKLFVAHGAGEILENATLVLSHGKQKTIPLPRLKVGDVLPLPPLDILLPDIQMARMERIDFELRASNGGIIARNYLEVALHPQRLGANPSIGFVWSPDPELRERLMALGYSISPNLEGASLALAKEHDKTLAAYVRGGGNLLLQAEGEIPLYPFFPHWQNVRVMDREETMWRGDWASSFSWLRRTGRFQSLPGPALLDDSFDRIIPDQVITGCNLLDFQSRVHAGMVVGWIHKPVALAVERPYGDGTLLASTFRLFRDPPGYDPTATILLDRFLSLAANVAEPSISLPLAEKIAAA